MTRSARFSLIALFCLALSALSAPGNAQTKYINEVKFGVLAHDIPFLGSSKEKGADINAELLFASPGFLKAIWAPRPHIGLSINTNGDTNHVYAGLTWEWALFRNVLRSNDAFTAGFSFGPSFNDGLRDTRRSDKKALGSNILFHESVELGYRITPMHSISIYTDHISNARLAKRNEGITNAGLRFGIKF
jgi:lipid A 3-O-deacylase